MKLTCFAIFDSKSAAYAQPFFSLNQETGLRAFITECRNPASGLRQHAEDYTLFELGEFDQETGFFEMHTAPLALGTALQHRNAEPLPEPSNGQDTQVTNHETNEPTKKEGLHNA